MSDRLPVVSGQKCIKFLQKRGFVPSYKPGSHVVLTKSGEEKAEVTVPLHKELRRGTLSDILRDAGVSREEFIRFFRKH